MDGVHRPEGLTRHGAMPWVCAIEGNAADASTTQQAIRAVLLGLLVCVVAGLAQRLPVRAIPEQLLIAAVRDLVVNHGCRFDATQLLMHAAQRVPSEERETFPTPTRVVEVVVLAHEESPGHLAVPGLERLVGDVWD